MGIGIADSGVDYVGREIWWLNPEVSVDDELELAVAGADGSNRYGDAKLLENARRRRHRYLVPLIKIASEANGVARSEGLVVEASPVPASLTRLACEPSCRKNTLSLSTENP